MLAELKRSQAAFPTGALSQAMQAVAFLARNEPKSDEVFHFLTAQLNHPREAVQTAAAQALGTLNDPRALAFLRPLTTVRKPFKNPVREAAATAIQQIESRQTGPAELSRLWNELQILQKKNQDLEAEMEKLKKKQDAKK